MSRLFDAMDDETPPSIGEEVGTAVAAAMLEVNKSNEATAKMLSGAIQQALLAVDSKKITLQKSSVKKWVFTVERDKGGLLSRVIATAET